MTARVYITVSGETTFFFVTGFTSAVGKGCGHHGQVFCRDIYGTLFCIDVGGLYGVEIHAAIGEEEVGDGPGCGGCRRLHLHIPAN